jgi:hypothetical protein
MTADVFVAEKAWTDKVESAERKGVISFKLVPTSIYALEFVPIAKKLSSKEVTHPNKALQDRDWETI